MKILKIVGLCFGALLLASCAGISSQPAHQSAEVVESNSTATASSQTIQTGASFEILNFERFYPAFIARCADDYSSSYSEQVKPLMDTGQGVVVICTVKEQIHTINFDAVASLIISEKVKKDLSNTCVPYLPEDPEMPYFFTCYFLP